MYVRDDHEFFSCWDSAWTDLRAIRRVFLFSFGFFLLVYMGLDVFCFIRRMGSWLERRKEGERVLWVTVQ